MIWKAIRAKAKTKIHLIFGQNTDQYYYHRNWPVHTSLNKVSNFKNSKIEESKPKVQEPKASNLNNSLYLDQGENVKTFNKSQKEIKKPWRQEKHNKNDFNPDISAFRVNITNNSNGKKHVQMDKSQVTCLNSDKKSYYSNNYLEPPKP